MIIRPQPGPQETFLSTPADIAVYGGAAGGGKTWAILIEPLRHISIPDFGGVIFRRESPQIFNQGGLWDESQKLYPLLGASSKLQPAQWLFPRGSKLTMSHLQLENDVFNWQGAQIPFIGFDELTHFTRKQFLYMLSRNRSTCGIRPYIRATTNPDPDSWVLEFIDWWIDKDGYAIPERSGVVRYFIVVNDTLRWGDSPEELREAYGADCEPKSFTFIASSIFDNKILLKADPGYLANLKAQTEEQQMRLLHGNWKYRAEGGLVKRKCLKHLKPGEPLPDMKRIVVAIDPSVTATSASAECGITVQGLGVDDLGYLIADYSGILTPDQWATRAVNAYEHFNADLIVGEVNNGGDLVERNIKAVRNSVNFKAVRATRGKIIRLEPIAAFYERGQIVHAEHFDKLESQLCSYDPATMDKSPDRMDAAVWGFTELLLSGNTGTTLKLRGL